MSTSSSNGNGAGHLSPEAATTTTSPPPTLACPDDATQALAWLPATRLRLSPLYQQVPTPDAGKLRELAVSIARDGFLQPLLVTLSADGAQYEVLAGRRRLLVAGSAGTTLPALIRQFSPHQKHQAFLAANVCTVLPQSLDALTSAYEATWTTVPEGPTAEPSDATGEATSVAAMLAQLRQLSPFLRRHVARDLVTSDEALLTGMLAEARQQLKASEESECQRMEQELTAAQSAVRDAQLQQRRHTHTLEHLGQQLTEARVSYQRSEDQRHELERLRHELTNDNRHLREQVQTLSARLAAVGPVERLAGMPHVAALAQAAMDVVEAAGPPLVKHAIRLLDPRTAREAVTALTRALLLVEERIRTCRQRLAEDLSVTTPHRSAHALGQEEPS